MVRRRRGLAALLVAGALTALVPAAGSAGEEAKTSTVRIGLAATLFRDTPDALVLTMMRPFKSLMEAQTGLNGDLVPCVKPDELGQQLKDDKVQLAVFNGIEFAWARQKAPELTPLMLAVNHQKYLRACVVVRDDCAAAKLCDLKGKSLAVPRRTREHCHVYLDHRCAAAGKAPKEFFGKVTAPVNMELGVDAVVNGDADAVLIDDCFLHWYEQRKPARFAKLKVIEKSEEFPAAIVAYCAHALDDATLRRFREGMLSAKDNPRGLQLMTLCQMTSFEPVPADYDKLLKDIVKAYPPPEKKKDDNK
jgi:ABC-type phosphate/phosphonate transport system substrate-binding protein